MYHKAAERKQLTNPHWAFTGPHLKCCSVLIIWPLCKIRTNQRLTVSWAILHNLWEHQNSCNLLQYADQIIAPDSKTSPSCNYFGCKVRQEKLCIFSRTTTLKYWLKDTCIYFNCDLYQKDGHFRTQSSLSTACLQLQHFHP